MAVPTTRPPVAPVDPVAPSDRLPRAGVPLDRGREVRLGLAGGVGLLAIVVGIPAVLVLCVGYPLPTTAPSRAWLTVGLSATLLVKTLACVVWLVWAHFAVCLLSEWRALRRGRLAPVVPLGGGSQLVARRLVAAVLLLAGTATLAPHGAPAGPPARPAPAVAAARPGVVADVDATTTPKATTVTAPDAPAAAVPAPTRFYVVEPPAGRHHDSLWDIAGRTLGDPLRYREVFALNQDVVQPDGRTLTDAQLIRPGWQLILPGDATGPGVQEMPVQSLPAPAAPVAPAAPAPAAPAPAAVAATAIAPAASAAPGGAVTDVARPGPGTAAVTGATGAPGSAAAGDPAPAPLSLALGGGMVLAGLALALRSRRGPYGEPVAEDLALARGADEDLAARLDAALRDLCAARTAQGRAMPQPYVAHVSSGRVALQLVGPDLADPPAPWVADDAARTWTRPLDGSGGSGGSDGLAATGGTGPAAGPAPYPGLVPVGRRGEDELFLDLEQVPGVLAVGGDLDRARDLAAALAVSLATASWSEGARLTVVGFGDAVAWTALDRPGAGRVAQTADLDAVLDDVERAQAHTADTARRLGLDSVLQGRQQRPDGPWAPHVLVLSAPPTAEQAARLTGLVGTGRSAVVALCVGDLPTARWRFVVDGGGRLTTGVLGVEATAHRLPPADVARVLQALPAADERARRAAAQVLDSGPRAAVDLFAPPGAAGAARAAGAADPEGRPDGPDRPDGPLAPAAAAAGATVSVLVSLLGPVEVQAPGPVEAARVPLLTELVVAVALAPDGLHDAVLRACLWPRGADDAVVAAATAEAVTWLGRDAAGQARLRLDPDGRWRTGPDVALDTRLLAGLAAAAAGRGELDTLLRAVDLIRGEAASQTPAGRYGWLAFARAARDARALGTVVIRRAAALLVAAGRRAEAVTVLRTGLSLVPVAEPLWRDLLALLGDDHPAALPAETGRLYATLRAAGLRPEPATDALVEALVPHRGSGAGA